MNEVKTKGCIISKGMVRPFLRASKGAVKGMNWRRFVNTYGEKMKTDDLYLGVLSHLITDGVWFHEIMEPQVRSEYVSKEERQKMYEEFGLEYELKEDRNIELDGLHPELYDDVIGALYGDFCEEPPAAKEEPEVACTELCIAECVTEEIAEGKGVRNR